MATRVAPTRIDAVNSSGRTVARNRLAVCTDWRAVGKFQAMRIALTGCMVKAPEALAIGMVSEVVEDAQTLPRALALAAEIAALPGVEFITP